jgi:hypothetical protein
VPTSRQYGSAPPSRSMKWCAYTGTSRIIAGITSLPKSWLESALAAVGAQPAMSSCVSKM